MKKNVLIIFESHDNQKSFLETGRKQVSLFKAIVLVLTDPPEYHHFQEGEEVGSGETQARQPHLNPWEGDRATSAGAGGLD